MTIVKGLLNLALLFLIILILLAGYIFYRQAQTPSGADVVRDFSQKNIDTIPATTCSYDVSDFNGTSGGLLRIYNGQIRLETATVEGNASGILRVVISRDDTYWVDPSTVDTIPRGGDQEEMINSYIMSAPWTCSPWWFPDQALFNVT